MGLFGGSEPDGPAKQLADTARGSSVTAERLTAISGSIMGLNHLEQEPLVELLRDNEQPNYYFYNANKGLTRDGNTVGNGMSADYRTMCLITSDRVLLVTSGTKGEAIQYGAIKSVETNDGRMKHRLTIATTEADYTIYIAAKADFDEVEAAAEYIKTRSSGSNEPDFDTEPVDGLQEIWSPLDSGVSVEDALNAEPQGSYVTTARFQKVNDILDTDEVVHYITRGGTVDVEGSGAGTSLFGDNRSRKSGTRGYVRAVVTNKRVVIKVPQFLGNDERSVPFTNITSVDLDTGLVNKRLTLQTPGQTYHIEAHEPGKNEVREAIRFIREKISEANQPQVVQTETETDPLDQLEQLKELNEQGVVSDSEFEEKKADLLDKI